MCNCKSYIGVFCTTLGGTVFAFVQFSNGVPTFTYYDTITGDLVTDPIVADCSSSSTSSGLSLVEPDILPPNQLQDSQFSGATIGCIFIEGVAYTNGFSLSGDTITFTDGTVVTATQSIKVLIS